MLDPRLRSKGDEGTGRWSEELMVSGLRSHQAVLILVLTHLVHREHPGEKPDLLGLVNHLVII